MEEAQKLVSCFWYRDDNKLCLVLDMGRRVISKPYPRPKWWLRLPCPTKLSGRIFPEPTPRFQVPYPLRGTFTTISLTLKLELNGSLHRNVEIVFFIVIQYKYFFFALPFQLTIHPHHSVRTFNHEYISSHQISLQCEAFIKIIASVQVDVAHEVLFS